MLVGPDAIITFDVTIVDVQGGGGGEPRNILPGEA